MFGLFADSKKNEVEQYQKEAMESCIKHKENMRELAQANCLAAKSTSSTEQKEKCEQSTRFYTQSIQKCEDLLDKIEKYNERHDPTRTHYDLGGEIFTPARPCGF